MRARRNRERTCLVRCQPVAIDLGGRGGHPRQESGAEVRGFQFRGVLGAPRSGFPVQSEPLIADGRKCQQRQRDGQEWNEQQTQSSAHGAYLATAASLA